MTEPARWWGAFCDNDVPLSTPYETCPHLYRDEAGKYRCKLFDSVELFCDLRFNPNRDKRCIQTFGKENRKDDKNCK